MIFFKSEKERFNEHMNKGFSERDKGSFEGAVRNFQQAYEIAVKSRDPELVKNADLALFYLLFYDALIKKTSDSFRRAAEQCRKLDPGIELNLGLANKIHPPELTDELELLADLYSLPSFDLSRIKSMSPETADRYEYVANKLLGKGSRRLLLEDLVDIHEQLSVMGLKYLGYAKMIRAAKYEDTDPGRAVELYSEAESFLQQSAPDIAKLVSDKISKLGKSTKCWICGREIQGEEINYLYLPASINEYIRSRYSGETPYLISDGKVAVCKVCYTMIRGLSDEIAKYYYDQVMQQIKLLETRLEARIRELETRITLLRTTTRIDWKRI